MASAILCKHALILECASLPFFAFSAENLQCPEGEVSGLLDLPAFYLQQVVINMNVNGVCFKVVSDTSGFDTRIQSLVRNKQLSTVHNDTLTSAANYSGRWDIVQAVKAWQAAHLGKTVDAMDETNLSLAYAPNPDLQIPTGGESRINDVMLLQMN